MPHLSIVIPTRDRPHLLVHALAALSAQRFCDFEVIVSDNSTSDQAVSGNRRAIADAGIPVEVRHVRPPDPMNMPDHWEWATRHARGSHVVVHTDRFLLRPSAMGLIAHYTACGSAGELISWNNHSSLGPGLIFREWPCSRRIHDWDAGAVLRRYARMDSWRTQESWMIWLPRCISACYSSTLASRVRDRCGRLFFPSNPDFTSAFLLLAHADRYCFIDRNLAVGHGTDSNGRRTLLFGPQHATHVTYRADWVDRSPVPMETITNALAVDLLTMRSQCPERMQGVDIDIANLYLSNLREVVSMETHGSFQDTRRMWRTLLELAGALASDDQERVHSGSGELDAMRPNALWLRRLMARGALIPAVRHAYGMMSRLACRVRGRTLFPTIQAALAGTDHLVGTESFPLPLRSSIDETP
jgi:hypothetical protein